MLHRVQEASLLLKRSKYLSFCSWIDILQTDGYFRGYSTIVIQCATHYPLHYPGLSSSKLHCVAGILGLSNFYHSDRQHLATTLEPILLRKHVHWQWEAGTQASFQEKHANRFQPPLLLRWAKRVHGGLRLFPIQHGSRTVIYYGRRLRVACGFCFQDT